MRKNPITSALFVSIALLAVRAKADTDYEKSCNRGERSSCHIMGNRHSAQESPQGRLKGVSFYRKACDSDYAPSCSALGYAYFAGHGVPVDLAKAASFYRKACEFGDTESCDSASLEVLRSRQKSAVDALQKAREGCDAVDANGCNFLANAYENGDGVKQDLAKAASLHSKACALGQPAGCMFLGMQHENGKGVPKDSAKAQAAYAKAVPLYLDGCNEGHGQSCARLGNIYEAGNGGVKDSKKAMLFYRKGCDLGHEPSCSNAARMDAGAAGDKTGGG